MTEKNFISFWKYFSECFVPFQELSLPLKPMHQEVCLTLEKAVLGQLPGWVRFIVINIAPRVGKTKILEALATWMLAYFPDSHLINTSFSSTLAEASTRYVQQVLKSSWYRCLFPWVGFGDIERSNEFTTCYNGHVYGAGVGGTLTGFGAGLKRPAGGFIAIDDPSNPNDTLSQVEAEKIKFWFENTILRRRNSSLYTPIILIQQRLGPEDLSGYLLKQYADQTLHLKFPALVGEESVIPETLTTEDIRKTKEMNPFVFWAQLQQEPIVMGGNLIKTADFLYYNPADIVKWDAKIITCDTALKAEEHHDWSVIQCWGKLNGTARLIDQARGKWESPELIENYHAFYRKHHTTLSPVSKATVEDKAAGTGLGQTLRRKGIPIIPIQRNKDKVTRVQEVLPYIVTHMVYLPHEKTAPWVAAFLSECAAFQSDGKAAFDDQVDSMCDGVWQTLGKPLSILDVLGHRREEQPAIPQ